MSEHEHIIAFFLYEIEKLLESIQRRGIGFINSRDISAIDYKIDGVVYHIAINATEELSELQKELCKELRGQGKRQNIIEEMADVDIMLKQLQIIFAITPQELMKMERDKLLRLEKRVEGATISGQA